MTYVEWITALATSQLGHLWLSKFQYDLKEGNLSPSIENTLKGLIEAKVLTLSLGLPPLSVVESVLKENPTLCDLQGKRAPTNVEPYSLIVRVETFAYYYLRRRVLMTILDESDDEVEFVWAHLGGVITPAFFEGWVKTDRDFFWCVPTRLLLDLTITGAPNKSATTIRTRLGLHLIDKGERLIRIGVPESAILGKKIAAPTTLDSGVNPAFVPFNSSDGYGRTLNLKSLTRDIKEVVIEKIRFESTFSAEQVGKVGAKLPPISWIAIDRLVT
ncbi:MAG TPA: hypothetical protein VEW46_05740 [Pyrinomonadaceae bacterium]|nr:hypothetical protein [Pyrinomonadaceae bacterium]